MTRGLFILSILLTSCGVSPESEGGAQDAQIVDSTARDGMNDQGDALDAFASDINDAEAMDTSMDLGDFLECETGTACNRSCVDTSTDINHCGGCGRTCFFFNASAECIEGECQLSSCDDGYFDADQDPSNGCELPDTCVAGLECETACQTVGTSRCESGVAVCTAPMEICNGLDDNCNGQCDENSDVGCRHSVARSFGPLGHAYHSDTAFLTSRGQNVERSQYFYVYNEPFRGMRPMFLCPKASGKYFLASGTACEPAMRAPVAELGFWSPTELCGSIPLYGLYKADSDNHFYTTSAEERASVLQNLGYEDRGIAGYVWPQP